MAMLVNIRQERFCQLICSGKDELESYSTAGYAPDRANACKMRHLPHIDRRIREIMQKGAERAEISQSMCGRWRILQALARSGA